MRTSNRRGFTIVELLVVIGIIAILFSLLFVGLRGALGTASKTREQNALRNLSYAWTMYSGSNSEYLLPGYLDPLVQEAWRLEWRDARGVVLSANDAAPYSWRIAPYVDFSWDVMMGYRDAAQKELGELPQSLVAERPAFGYNGLYVGGWWEPSGAGFSMRYSTLSTPGFAGLVARTQGSMRQPDSLVIFAASTEQPQGLFRNGDHGASAEGSHRVEPRIVAGEERWGPFANADQSIEVFVTTTPIPLARHSNSVAVAHADGSVTGAAITALADQRRWIDIAQDRNWTHPPN